MIELSNYGEIVRLYKGDGHLHFDENNFLECTFDIAQFQDGDVRLKIALRSLSDALQAYKISQETKYVWLAGTTNDNRRLEVKGPAIASRSNAGSTDAVQWIIFRFHGPTILRLGEPTWEDEAEARFGLTNFRFIGTEVEEITPKRTKLNLLPFELDNTTITIRGMLDYDERIEMLQTRGGIGITCEARLKITNPSEIDAIKESIRNLCKLLTIARGTLVSWLYFDVCLESQKIVYSEHYPAITKHYTGGYPLIDPRNLTDTKLFVESTYKQYTALDSSYNLNSVSHIYTDVRSENVFIETRSLALISLMEYLANKSVGKSKGNTLKKNLTYLFSYFRVPISDSEITNFVKTRNGLVHEMKFRTEDPQTEHLWLVHILDRLLLRMVGYSGHYLNITTSPLQRQPLIPK